MVSAGYAQPKAKSRPKSAKIKVSAKPAAKSLIDPGTVSGKTYRNQTLKFEVTFPDTWLIPGSDFEEYMKSQGFDLSLKAPASVGPVTQMQMNNALKKVAILLTVYRSMPGSEENAIMRISVEDLKTLPQVKDAVDYFDLMRSQFKAMKLPADFKYSETQAEKLSLKQFAFLDTSNASGKKRMYATVKNGQAILFTLSYNSDNDLQTMRQILAEGNFALR